MSSVVSYTLAKCQKCLKCLRVCPVEAISIKDERVRINKGRCINCGRCIDACVNQGLQAKGSTLDDLDNYDIRIALIPTSFTGIATIRNKSKNYSQRSKNSVSNALSI